MPGANQHSWGEPERFQRKTERECKKCGMIRVTRHEEEIWTEYWNGLDQVPQDGNRVPVCSGVPAL